MTNHNSTTTPPKPANPAQTPQKKPKPPQKAQTLRLILTILALLLWVAVVFIGVQIALAYLLSALLGDALNQPVWTALYSALAYTLSLLIIIFVPIKLFKRLPVTRESLGLKSTPTWLDILLAPVGFLVATVLAALLAWLFAALFPWFDANEAQNVGFNNLYDFGDRLVAAISLILIAPIAEELLFRGWLYGKLRAKIPGKLSIAISILLTSLLFAALHLQWNVAVSVFALSVILCLLREFTGTIYSGILLHILKNAVAFYLLYGIM